MKNTMYGLVMVALMASISIAAPTYYTPDVATLQGMTYSWAGDGSLLSATTVGNSVIFEAQLQSGDGTVDGWASMGIGYDWPVASTLGDLSGYDGYALTFKNTNNSNWVVNLYMNTGWTDAPYNQTDKFYQNGWTEIAPGDTVTLVLDFASADLYVGGVSQGLAAVENLNRVTNIGIQVGGNMDEYPYYSDSNPSNPDTFHITVSPVPAPGALLLGSMGVGLVGWLRRRRSL